MNKSHPMEEEKLLQEYIEWRLNGTESSNTQDLIHLHFYFRNLKKLEISKFFDSFFSIDEKQSLIDALSVSDDSLAFDLDSDYDFDFGESAHSLPDPTFDAEESKRRRILEEENQENDLVIGLVNGEESAYHELYEREFLKIREYIIGNSGSLADAQDIFQDCVVILLEKLKTPGFKLTCKAGTYLYSCCRNLWLKQLKKSSREISSDYYEIYDFEEIDVYEEPDNQEEKLKLILSKLSESCLKIIQAFYYELKSWDKIAVELGYSSVNSAKNQKYKCLKKIIY